MTAHHSADHARRTAHRDQYRAATRHARRHLAALSADHGGPVTGTASPWLACQLAALGAALATGTAQTCPHITDAPAVVHAAVWAPGRLVCGHCLPALIPDPAEDATCDRCRKPADVVTPALASFGPLLIAFGLCPPCTRHLEGTRR
ncbi:hypothetical protein [Actinomadura napierensis]|uniref:Uncharacterized protein n=1 Tax=Actinomadura napierensis TaxID=267854 RepID=A0ABN2YZS8_9ACTN